MTNTQIFKDFKFNSYNAFNFTTASQGAGIKIEVYRREIRIDYFDYVSQSKSEALSRLRYFLKEGFTSDSVYFIKGVCHLRISFRPMPQGVKSTSEGHYFILSEKAA